MQRFPEHRDALRRMYRQSGSFQSICDDYRLCLEALEHWKRSTHEQALERCREYSKLLRDLESEIQNSLEEAD